MQLAQFTLPNPVFVAPMAGVTDRPFRQLCRRFGAGHAVSEMVTSKKELWNSLKTSRRADHSGEPGPIAVQIAGVEAEEMAEAARYNIARGAQIEFGPQRLSERGKDGELAQTGSVSPHMEQRETGGHGQCPCRQVAGTGRGLDPPRCGSTTHPGCSTYCPVAGLASASSRFDHSSEPVRLCRLPDPA